MADCDFSAQSMATQWKNKTTTATTTGNLNKANWLNWCDHNYKDSLESRHEQEMQSQCFKFKISVWRSRANWQHFILKQSQLECKVVKLWWSWKNCHAMQNLHSTRKISWIFFFIHFVPNWIDLELELRWVCMSYDARNLVSLCHTLTHNIFK